MTTASQIIDHFLKSPKEPLGDMPVCQGIYALADHDGVLRYVGRTEQGILSRVNRYHVTGTRNSHKYSCAYNCGKMFHDQRIANSQQNGTIAKKLRTHFIRTKCTAIAFTLPDITLHELKDLEEDVIAGMPTQATSWNNRTVIDPVDYETISKEVDTLIREMDWSWEKQQAVKTQAALYDSITQRE